MRGFEPPTPASRKQCATKLRHIPQLNRVLSIRVLVIVSNLSNIFKRFDYLYSHYQAEQKRIEKEAQIKAKFLEQQSKQEAELARKREKLA